MSFLGASVVVSTEIPLNRYSFFEALEDELLPSTRMELNMQIESDANLIWLATDDCRVIITRMQLIVPRLRLLLTLKVKHCICSNFSNQTRSPQGLYNWAACDVTNPILSPLLSLTFQVISGTPQIFRLLIPRDKKRYYAT